MRFEKGYWQEHMKIFFAAEYKKNKKIINQGLHVIAHGNYQ
jgi:hypothetical protein